MFSLIITIISIALVAALAVATLFYGGDAFARGTERAHASTIIAQGQQIDGAIVLYTNDKAAPPADLDALLGDYLSDKPVPPKSVDGVWVYDGGNLTLSGVSKPVCDRINDMFPAVADKCAEVDDVNVFTF